MALQFAQLIPVVLLSVDQNAVLSACQTLEGEAPGRSHSEDIARGQGGKV